MRKIIGYIFKTLLWTVAGVLGLVVVMLVLLYLPPVQDFATEKALSMINSKGDMQIKVNRLRLRFPLDLRVDSLRMVTQGMEIAASRADASVAVLPLLKGHVNARLIGLRDAVVNIGTPDSSLYMRARLMKAGIKDASVGLASQKIDIGLLTASGGDIDMVMTPDTIAKPDTVTAPLQWQINLERAQLRNIDYRMQMLPVIADLDCTLPLAVLTDGEMKFADSRITVGELAVSKIDARYLTPSAEYLASHPAADNAKTESSATDSTASAPWEITARRLRIVDSHALYATEGSVATSGFDPAYIEASQINIEVDSFRNRGMEITVPLRRFSACERCGLTLNAYGTFSMDSTAMRASEFHLNTPASEITLNAMMWMQPVNPPLNLNLAASLATEDIALLLPATVKPMVSSLPAYVPVNIEADIAGRMENLELRRVGVEMPRYLTLSMRGAVSDYADLNRARGDVDITGALINGNFLKPTLFDAKMRRQVDLPPLRIAGNASLNRGVIDGALKVITGNGDVALDAMWNNRREAYDVDLAFRTFPLQSILTQAGASDLTADITLDGTGIDPFSPKTSANAKIDLKHVVYQGREYNNITLDAIVGDGNADITAHSANRPANFTLKAAGNLAGETYNWTFDGDVRNIDLRALALSDTTADGSVKLSGRASFRPAVAPTRRAPGRPMAINADVDIADFYWHMPGEAVNGSDISLKFDTDSTTAVTLINHDLDLRFSSTVSLDTLMAGITKASAGLSRDLTRRRLAIDSLQAALPPLRLTLKAGSDNVVSNYLAGSDISFSNLGLNLTNDTIINGNAIVENLKIGKTQLDTITLNLHQKGSYMLYELAMNNRPGTLDQFAHAEAKGYINADRVALLMKQQNLEGETGYSLGLMASMTDSTTVGLRFVPFHPIIGYKEWEINRDNFIRFNMADKHLDADIDLKNEVSSLRLFTSHNANDSVQEDINLQLKDIKLSDWLAINPFAPAITGDLSADLRVGWHKPDLNGTGTVNLTDFTYGKERVGDFGLDLDVKTNASGTVSASTVLSVNGVKAITAVGNLNDSTAANPFMLDFRMIRFPLAVANPFLPNGTAKLHGVLNGEMDVTGNLSDPIFNGYLDFDSTTVDITMLGTPLKFSEEKIPVDSNIVTFDNFSIMGLNKKPLTINGTVDMRSLSDPRLDLALKARNMQIVGTQKTRKSQVYGKAFIDLDAKARGSLQLLDIDAALELLPGTNVTYVMLDAISDITSRSNQDMVKFVNFNDTAAVAEADTVAAPSMLMNIDARLTVSTGTTVSVDLSADGKNKVQLQSAGTLNYTMDYMDDQRFTGRLNLNGGFVRYSIPVMGEKMFSFNEGSYVVFNGDMMNPQLNIDATDNVRANVSQSGTNSRVVNFDVGLKVTGSLDEMNVVFDLACPDDITIANELKSMTPEQRANQAMNLLITGIYRAGGTQTISSGNAGTNALFSFLESQLNSWASSAIKGVDLSFGINQYDKTVDGTNTTSMSYSYRVSKSLFDDRFKIVVGGNYATDAEADENFAQNLIADISFEYMLNKAGTMYVKLFRHTGYESILEGEITQTGVGFVYKKKIHRLGDIFNFLRRRPKKEQILPALPSQSTPDTPPAPETASNNRHAITSKNSQDEKAE